MNEQTLLFVWVIQLVLRVMHTASARENLLAGDETNSVRC